MASSCTCSQEAESRAAPKKGPSYGRKMGPKKVKADCRPSQFGGRILVRIEGVIFRPPSLEKQHRETAGPPSGTLLAAHATARGQTSHATRGVQSSACKAHSENATRNPMKACCCLACGAQFMCVQPMHWWQNLRKTFRMAPPPMLPASLSACCPKDTAQVRRVTAHIHMRHSEHPPSIGRRACFMRAPVAAPRRRHVPSLLLPPVQPLLHPALRPRSSSGLPYRS